MHQLSEVAGLAKRSRQSPKLSFYVFVKYAFSQHFVDASHDEIGMCVLRDVGHESIDVLGVSRHEVESSLSSFEAEDARSST